MGIINTFRKQLRASSEDRAFIACHDVLSGYGHKPAKDERQREERATICVGILERHLADHPAR